MKTITRFFGKMTMYRMALYFMLALLLAAAGLSAVGWLPYNPWEILLQTFLFVVLCRLINAGIAHYLQVKPNVESAIITGFILASIAGPMSLREDWPALLIMCTTAMASKYLFAIRRSHIFNPAAFGVVVSGFLGFAPSWWIGSKVLLPIILAAGVLLAQKMRRLHLIVTFLAVYGVLLVFDVLLVRGGGFVELVTLINVLLFSSPLLFFCFIMLVEPLTSPQTKNRRMLYGAFVAFVSFIPQWFFSLVPFSLELALLVGNIFSRIINPDFRQVFALRKKESFSPDIRGFWFEPVRAFPFIPGQYLEYTFSHPNPDSRGVRRYFSIASAPHEEHILLVTRISTPGSTFKQALTAMQEGDELVASKVAGDFVLPQNPTRKLVFIAGGIGITPFRSMLKYLLDRKEHRNIVLFYCAREVKDFVFRDICEEAEKIGVRVVYVLSDMEKIPSGWVGRTGILDAHTINAELSDIAERDFYISGPEPMVEGISKTIVGMGIPQSQILHDYFPGYDTQGESTGG